MNISQLSYVLSEKVETISSLSDQGEIPANEALILEKIMGLQYVPRDQNINHSEQLNNVIEKLLSEHRVDPLSIKYILFAHTSDYLTPCGFNILSNISKKYGFNNALCFGSSVYKCASAFHLLKLAENFFHDLNDQDYILLLIGDLAFTNILQYIPGSTVLGDAASAILLQKSSRHNRFIDFIIETYGEFAKGLWGDRNEQLLFQSTYIKYLCNIIIKIVSQNDLALSQIKYIFPHNVNKISWRQVIQALSLLHDQVYLNNVSRTAHCFGSDPFINLTDAIEQNLLQNGDYYLLVTIGLGATFAATLFQY